MKERPILFSGLMVRAIRDGNKFQTRRIVKPNKSQAKWLKNDTLLKAGLDYLTKDGAQFLHPMGGPLTFIECPYGKVGDRLWVRETWGYFDPSWGGSEWVPDRPFAKVKEMKFGQYYVDGNIIWRADGPFAWAREDSDFEECSAWKPSIHMPRWASRINLEITKIRVERLQGISNEDIRAEGIKTATKDGTLHKHGLWSWPWQEWQGLPVSAFSKLWTSINGESSWDNNPWVWVIEFKRVETVKW